VNEPATKDFILGLGIGIAIGAVFVTAFVAILHLGG
jgi:hypothetical protein